MQVLDSREVWRTVEAAWRRRFVAWGSEAATKVGRINADLEDAIEAKVNSYIEELCDAANTNIASTMDSIQQVLDDATDAKEEASELAEYLSDSSQEDAAAEAANDAAEHAADVEADGKEMQDAQENCEAELARILRDVRFAPADCGSVQEFLECASRVATRAHELVQRAVTAFNEALAELQEEANDRPNGLMGEHPFDAAAHADVDFEMPEGWERFNDEQADDAFIEALDAFEPTEEDDFASLATKLARLPLPASLYLVVAIADEAEPPEPVVYVGETSDFAVRFNDGHRSLALLNNPAYDGRRKRLLVLGCRVSRVPLGIEDNGHARTIRKSLEAALIHTIQPALNTQGRGRIPEQYRDYIDSGEYRVTVDIPADARCMFGGSMARVGGREQAALVDHFNRIFVRTAGQGERA